MKTIYFCDPLHSLYGKIMRIDIKHIKNGAWWWVSDDNKYYFNTFQLRNLFEAKKIIILSEEDVYRYKKLKAFL